MKQKLLTYIFNTLTFVTKISKYPYTLQNILLTNYFPICFSFQMRIDFKFVNFLDDYFMVFACYANAGTGHILKTTLYEHFLPFEK